MSESAENYVKLNSNDESIIYEVISEDQAQSLDNEDLENEDN